MARGPTPDQVANQFFQSLMHNQCSVCWGLFTTKTQIEFLQWTLNDIYQRNPEAARVSQIGGPEVKLLFEKNDTTIMKTFWKRFFYSSYANDFFRFGYYEIVQMNNKMATVLVTFRYPNGQTHQKELKMFNERGGWKLGYIESEMPF